MKPGSSPGVSSIMKPLVLVVAFAFAFALAGCGGKQPTPAGNGSGDPPGVVTDTRTELERRRDVGCEKLEPRLVQCAVDDAKAELDAGRMSKKDYDLNTAPEIRAQLGKKWMEECQVQMSSRQVRVLEVCFESETQCGPLVGCLAHLNAAPAK